MRILLFTMLVLTAAIFTAGCTQNPADAAPPTQPATPVTQPVATQPPSTAGIYATREINVTAWQAGNNVIVKYSGGRDAPDLLALRVRIGSYSGKADIQTFESPSVGQEYVFHYVGTPDADSVNVVGKFRDGTEQTVLMTTL
jgi:hypothetical protein